MKALKIHRQRIAMDPHNVKEDMIDLSDLWRVLWRWKIVVLGMMLVTVAIGVGYLLIVPRVYKVETIVALPSKDDVSGTSYTPRNAYDHFVQNLKSPVLQQHYIETFNAAHHGAAGGNRVSGEEFARGLSIHEKALTVSVSLDAEDAMSAAEYLNGLVTTANKETVKFLVLTSSDARKRNEKELRRKIALKRLEAEQDRKSRIVKLDEAARIAELAGIKDYSMLAAGNLVVIDSSSMPLYFRGTKALRAQAKVLRERKDDDPFVPGILQLKLELAELESTPPSDVSHVSSVKFVQMAMVPSKASNGPKRVMLISLFGGLVLGMFAAFFADLIATGQKKERCL